MVGQAGKAYAKFFDRSEGGGTALAASANASAYPRISTEAFPSVTRGVLNDAISIYFADATLADAFVAGWCAGSRVETAGGVFRVREDKPAPRTGVGYIGRHEGG
jgi:hypothetical protein